MADCSIVWKRSDISSCNCSDKSYRHVHCPCQSCNGKAVDRHSEFRHWKDSQLASRALRNEPQLREDRESLVESCVRFVVPDEEIILPGVSEEENVEVHDVEQQESDIINDAGRSNSVNQDCNPLKTLVINAVIDALSITRDSGASLKTFQDILNYGKNLLLARIDNTSVDREIILALWPKNWNSVQKLLREEGYEDAKLYYICICGEEKEYKRKGKTNKKMVYTGKFSVMEGKHELCSYCQKKGYIKYYYLGLHTKIKNWFKNKEMCKKMLSHWYARDNWLRSDISNAQKTEIWDGDRWVELKWFWDPTSAWPLPTMCPFCEIPVSADHLLKSEDSVSGAKHVDCPNCYNDFQHVIKTAHGSPLNLALIGHWDGWQPFGTSYKGCGSIEVTIANMTKNDRNHVAEVYVLGFVPSSEVPKLPETLDPFLKPLMTDLCEGFINGFKVCYPRDVQVDDYFVCDEETVRILLLCWSGDHPGQCEVGKILNQGCCPCRRCKLVGQQLQNSSNTHMYYGENRYHYRYPWEERSIKSSIDDMLNIDNENRVSVRKSLSSAKGFTGTSILHKYLYPLYEFDILTHLTYDIFHTIPLNVVKNQLERLLEQKVIDQSLLDAEIKGFPWTKGLQNGRIPTPLGKCSGPGHWKAEGLRKFSFPMADCIFRDIITNEKELEIQSIISRLTEMHFVSGRRAWNQNMIDLHKNLAWKLNILVEELQGLHMCTISLHNLVHIHEDINTFSAPDNYWCATFERAVKQYVKLSHNCKGIESTFAQSEQRREFLKSLGEKDEVVSGYISKELGFASSILAAQRESTKDPSNDLFLLGTPKANIKELSMPEKELIGNALHIPICDVPPSCLMSKKAFINNNDFTESNFDQGDTVIINVSEEELVVKIDNFLSVRLPGHSSSTLPLLGSQYKFQLTEEGFVAQDILSGFVKVQTHPLEIALVPLQKVQRKAILFHCTDGWLVVDYQRHMKKLLSEVVVPVYCNEKDMVLIQGEQNEIWHGHVQSVNHQAKTVDVFFFVESCRNQGMYIRESQGRHARNTVHWDSVVGVANGEWINSQWKKL